MSYGLLKGKKGIIFGALNNQSIAWKVAEKCHEEGAEFINNGDFERHINRVRRKRRLNIKEKFTLKNM